MWYSKIAIIQLVSNIIAIIQLASNNIAIIQLCYNKYLVLNLKLCQVLFDLFTTHLSTGIGHSLTNMFLIPEALVAMEKGQGFK